MKNSLIILSIIFPLFFYLYNSQLIQISSCTQFQSSIVLNNNTVIYNITQDLLCVSMSILPIGNSNLKFMGTIEGNLFKIQDLRINSNSNHTGIFAYGSGCSINNFGTRNIQIESNTSSHVGTFFGICENCIFNNIQIQQTNISSSNQVAFVGGICAESLNCSFTSCNCENGKFSADSPSNVSLGTITGSDKLSNITSCSSNHNTIISSTSFVSNLGGIIGSSFQKLFLPFFLFQIQFKIFSIVKLLNATFLSLL